MHYIARIEFFFYSCIGSLQFLSGTSARKYGNLRTIRSGDHQGDHII